MIIGVPREIKKDEYRVAMLPVGVKELVKAGHTVLIETGVGIGSGLPYDEYQLQGAELIASGYTDAVLVCCLDLVTEFVFAGFSALQALSTDPCRPFDRDRDGLSLGEALGMSLGEALGA